MAQKNALISGITELLILSILDQGDSYGYALKKTISDTSGDLLAISPNTVYTSTYKLLREEKISEYTKLVGRKRTRVYYHLEPKGKEHLQKIQEEYAKITEGVKRVLDSLTSPA